MDASTVTAIYAAVVSTVVAAWQIRSGLRDRGELRVRCLPVYPGQTEFVNVRWEIANHGSRALVLDHVGCVVRRRLRRTVVFFDEEFCSPSLPRQLNPGEVCVLESSSRVPERLTYYAAWDTQGRCYKMRNS